MEIASKWRKLSTWRDQSKGNPSSNYRVFGVFGRKHGTIMRRADNIPSALTEVTLSESIFGIYSVRAVIWGLGQQCKEDQSLETCLFPVEQFQ
jgi:hypothetical protein